MASLILLSLILFSVLVPVGMSKTKSPRKTLRRIQIATVVVAFVWAYLALTYYPQLVQLD
jgi:hypothetical protein